MKQLVIFTKGSITDQDKERMSKEGFLAIESDDPSKVIMPIPSSDLASGDDILMSALCAVQKSGLSEAEFAQELFRRLKEKESK